jgi:hypothetical protein
LLSDNCKSLGRVHVGASWPPAWSAHAATAAAMHRQHPGCDGALKNFAMSLIFLDLIIFRPILVYFDCLAADACADGPTFGHVRREQLCPNPCHE